MKDGNRIAVVTTTTGTGTLTAGSAVTGHQSFATAFGTGGNTEVYYGIVKEDSGEWEVGLGTFLGATNQLQRDLVTESSSGGSKINFPSGNKLVYVTRIAETTMTLRARRATDTVLTLRAAAGQSVPLLETFNSGGVSSLSVDAAGSLVLSSVATPMMIVPQTDAGATVIVRRDLLGSPGVAGVRYRWSGTGTNGVLQLSNADSGYVQIQPLTGEVKVVTGDGDTGATFVDGIKIRTPRAQIGGIDVGSVAFDCEGGSGDTSWDISPANNVGNGAHSVRVGRTSGVDTTVRFIVLVPGTTTTAVELNSDGFASVGDYFIGADPTGLPGDFISRKSGSGLVFRAGLTSGILMAFRDSADDVAARIYPAGTSTSGDPLAIMTREKGDARYQAISSRRFKIDIEPAHGLADKFAHLRPMSFVWAGEVPEDDERRGTVGVGFIAEEVVDVLPEAGRYVRDGDGAPVLQGLDPLALCAVLHAKIAEQEARITALEALVTKQGG